MTLAHGSSPQWSWSLSAPISCGVDPQISSTYFAGGNHALCPGAFAANPTLSPRCRATTMERAGRFHVVLVIPPQYAVSSIVGQMKANLSRQLRLRYPELKRTYWGAVLWSPGFFSSTVGLNEAVVRRYVEHQERVAQGQIQLEFEF